MVIIGNIHRCPSKLPSGVCVSNNNDHEHGRRQEAADELIPVLYVCEML